MSVGNYDPNKYLRDQYERDAQRQFQQQLMYEQQNSNGMLYSTPQTIIYKPIMRKIPPCNTYRGRFARLVQVCESDWICLTEREEQVGWDHNNPVINFDYGTGYNYTSTSATRMTVTLSKISDNTSTAGSDFNTWNGSNF